LADPSTSQKWLAGFLLAAGVAQLRIPRTSFALALLAAGWGWFAANFLRAVAD